jgi:hypothetical protein
MAMADNKPELVEMTNTQKKAQRRRSVAIGLVLAAFVIIVYVGSWAKMGGALFSRPM